MKHIKHKAVNENSIASAIIRLYPENPLRAYNSLKSVYSKIAYKIADLISNRKNKKHKQSIANKVYYIAKMSKSELVLEKLKSFIESKASTASYKNSSCNDNEEKIDISSTPRNFTAVDEDKRQMRDFRMSSTTNNITCPKCEIVLRPPFKTCRDGHLLCKNCRQHIDAVTEEPVAFAQCGDNQFPMTVLNKLLNSNSRNQLSNRNPSDECQYGCGHHGNVVDLTDHEDVCPLRSKCAVYSCSWLGGLAKLIKHVEDDHPGILVDASAVEDNFTLDFEYPVMLVTRFNKTSPSNDLYWLRLHQNEDNSQFVVMQYQGQVGQIVDKKFLINEYYVYPVNHPNLPINNEVIFPNSNQDVILNDKFVESQGTDVTVFKADKFLIKIKDVFDTETVSENLECYMCTKIRPDLCETCSEKVTNACPNCPKEINTLPRNNSQDALPDGVLMNEGNVIKMEEGIRCLYVESGCSFTSDTDVDEHVRECEYQPTKCMHEVMHNYRCYWKGSHKAFLDHIVTDHQNYVKDITSETKFSLKSNNCFYYVYDNNYFKLWIDKGVRTVSGYTQKYCNIFFCHLTTQGNSDYNYGIRMISNTTTLPKIFGGHCEPYGLYVEPLGQVIINDSYALTMVVIISHRDD